MNKQPPVKSERRNFLKVAALGAGFSLLPANVLAAETAPALVPKRVLGKSGVMVSSLSMGTMFDTITNQAVLRLAIRLGITHWDTAESYEGGRAEQGIGQYLQRNPQARQNIFLVTKSYSLARKPEEMNAHLEESLKRMQTAYVDTFYVHGIDKIEDVNRPEIEQWAKQAKDSGKIKYFGFSAHRNMADLLNAAARLPWLDNVMFTYNYRIMHMPAMKQAVQAAYDAGLGLVAMKTQGERSHQTEGSQDTGLSEAFEKQGFSPEQARLKAVWEDQRIASVCSQMPNLAIMQANAAAAMDQTKLGAGQQQALQRYAQATACDYCAGCAAICENIVGLPVADIMRSLMYYQAYGQPLLARQTYAALLPKQPASQEKLAQAQAACPQGVDIARALRAASMYLA